MSTADISARSTSKPARYLRQHRIRLTLWVAAVEGVLTLIHFVPHVVVYILAPVAVGFWATAGRKYRSATARQASWIFATSQALAVLVPVVWFIAKAVAIGLIVVLAIGALIFLFADRERK
ncbi:MAG: hypothetical protein WCH31_05310 [Actinomycetes bacterium]